MSVFGENDSRCLSNFLQTHIFWNFDHISRTYNQINYRNIWFAKVIIILIMTAQVLFFDVFFSEKDPHLNAVEFEKVWTVKVTPPQILTTPVKKISPSKFPIPSPRPTPYRYLENPENSWKFFWSARTRGWILHSPNANGTALLFSELNRSKLK